jgi:KaiC/GvpD/RAD55 family RecA-like ATPase
MYEIDESQIRLWWSVFNPQNKLVEIRLLGKNTYSGYFKDIDTLIAKIRPLLDHSNYQYYGAMQAYFTLNEINDALYSREQRDTFVKKPKSTSTDADVTRRRFVMLDFDACRVASVSSSDEEYEKAHLKAVEVYKYLIAQGFKEPIVSTSGNGFHCYLPCDMPNDDEHTELVKRFLKSLGKMFSDDSVELDEVVYNAARVDKVVGTWAKKGSDSEDRKWRMARILKVPTDLSPNDDALFKKIADLLPKEEPKVAPNRQRPMYNNNAPFDLRTWLNEHGIVYKEEKQTDGTKFVLEHCAWEDTHSTKQKWDSALFLDNEGKITFNCFHSHCKNKTWFDYRMVYEPDAYSKPAYQPQPQYAPRQYAPQKPKYEIKEELPELGEKWLALSSIKKVDLTQLEKVKTGFIELDKKIGGLYMSEVTVLSGSNSSGKSSWLNSLILNIIQQGYKVALWSGELRSDILKTWLQMVAAGAENLRKSQYDEGRYYVPDGIGQRIDQWLDGKFFLYNNGYGTKAEQILHDMKILLKANVKVFVLDNLMSLDVDLFDGDKNAKQKELILKIKDFAMNEQVHILLVAHPRKVMTFLRKNDISGTSDITNAVDNVFIIHRTNEDFIHAITEFYDASKANQLRRYGNVLSVEKNRLYGVVDFMCGFHYDIISRRFLNEAGENVKYGWEEAPKQVNIPFYPPTERKERTEAHDDSYRNDLPWDAPQETTAPF